MHQIWRNIHTRRLKSKHRGYGGKLRKIATDKLRSYVVVHRKLSPETLHVSAQHH